MWYVVQFVSDSLRSTVYVERYSNTIGGPCYTFNAAEAKRFYTIKAAQDWASKYLAAFKWEVVQVKYTQGE